MNDLFVLLQIASLNLWSCIMEEDDCGAPDGVL